MNASFPSSLKLESSSRAVILSSFCAMLSMSCHLLPLNVSLLAGLSQLLLLIISVCHWHFYLLHELSELFHIHLVDCCSWFVLNNMPYCFRLPFVAASACWQYHIIKLVSLLLREPLVALIEMIRVGHVAVTLNPSDILTKNTSEGYSQEVFVQHGTQVYYPDSVARKERLERRTKVGNGELLCWTWYPDE